MSHAATRKTIVEEKGQSDIADGNERQIHAPWEDHTALHSHCSPSLSDYASHKGVTDFAIYKMGVLGTSGQSLPLHFYSLTSTAASADT